MRIEQSYKYEKDGIRYVGGEVPDGATIIETLDILCADEGYELWRKNSDECVGTSIWLRPGDSQRYYTEKPIQELKNANNN